MLLPEIRLSLLEVHFQNIQMLFSPSVVMERVKRGCENRAEPVWQHTWQYKHTATRWEEGMRQVHRKDLNLPLFAVSEAVARIDSFARWRLRRRPLCVATFPSVWCQRRLRTRDFFGFYSREDSLGHTRILNIELDFCKHASWWHNPITLRPVTPNSKIAVKDKGIIVKLRIARRVNLYHPAPEIMSSANLRA